MATAAMELTVEPVVNPRGRAVKYAEELGLNKVHNEAVAASSALGVLYHQRAQHEAAIRELKAAIAEVEAQVNESVRKENPDLGPTAFERLVKLAVASNDKLTTLGGELRNIQRAAGEIEAEIRSNEVSLRVCTARMNELGGYFAYLAASKEALTAERILGQIP